MITKAKNHRPTLKQTSGFGGTKTHNNEKAIHTNRKCVLLDCHIDNRRHRYHNIDVDIRPR
jgi:hypothetical protein